MCGRSAVEARWESYGRSTAEAEVQQGIVAEGQRKRQHKYSRKYSRSTAEGQQKHSKSTEEWRAGRHAAEDICSTGTAEAWNTMMCPAAEGSMNGS
eukprot:10667051-Lingulodinium_polyedra.AAC.1